MRPFFFGEAGHRLFGVYTPAQARRTPHWAVVCCSAVGQEGLRSHRSMRLLADRMAADGVDVLRFDYYGTGDSEGGVRDGDPRLWPEDVGAALRELRDITGARRLALVGLRLGGLLAACAQIREVNRLLLWDPVLSGAQYAVEMERRGGEGVDGEIEVDGFPVTKAQRAALEELSLDKTCRLPKDTRVVWSSESAIPAAWLEDVRSQDVRLELETTVAPPCWTEEGNTGAGAVPVEAIRTIFEWTR